MIKKKRPFPVTNHPPFWSVLAFEKAYEPHLTTENFMRLLQAQYKDTSMPDKGPRSKYLKAPFVM